MHKIIRSKRTEKSVRTVGTGEVSGGGDSICILTWEQGMDRLMEEEAPGEDGVGFQGERKESRREDGARKKRVLEKLRMLACYLVNSARKQ